MVFIHASCDNSLWQRLWSRLLQLCGSGLPMLLVGDFNVILSASEKKGGRSFTVAKVADFSDFIQAAVLIDVGFSGLAFTWCNNHFGQARVLKRLDRLLVNHVWDHLQVQFSVQHLGRTCSDHSPLILAAKPLQQGGLRSFWFLNVWCLHHSFLEVVWMAWDVQCEGRPWRKLLMKLKEVKMHLTRWNKEVFGNIPDGVLQAKEEFLQNEAMVENDLSDVNMFEFYAVQARLKVALRRDEEFWRQKACLKWLKHSDSISRFFHASVHQKRACLHIHCNKNLEGEWLTELAKIK